MKHSYTKIASELEIDSVISNFKDEVLSTFQYIEIKDFYLTPKSELFENRVYQINEIHYIIDQIVVAKQAIYSNEKRDDFFHTGLIYNEIN